MNTPRLLNFIPDPVRIVRRFALLASVALPLAASACITPPPGMVAWWAGDNNAKDIQSANHGTLVNGATLTPNGKVGPAFSLDGVNDYVRVPTSPSLNPTGSFTIDAWVYVTADVIGGIAEKWGDSGSWNGQRAYALHTIAGGGVNFAISDNANQLNGSFHIFTTPGGLIPLNTWKHVAAVYNQTTGTRLIFVDGVQVASRTDPPVTITASIADLTIGGWLRSPTQEGYFFPGKIDEVEFFNRALSQAEIQAIFNAGSAGKCKPPGTSCLIVSFEQDTELGQSIPPFCLGGHFPDTVMIGGDCNEQWGWNPGFPPQLDDALAAANLVSTINTIWAPFTAYHATPVGATAVLISPKAGGIIPPGSVLEVSPGCLAVGMAEVPYGSRGAIINFEPGSACQAGGALREEGCPDGVGICDPANHAAVTLTLTRMTPSGASTSIHTVGPWASATDQHACAALQTALVSAGLRAVIVGKTTLWIQEDVLSASCVGSTFTIGTRVFGAGTCCDQGCLAGVSNGDASVGRPAMLYDVAVPGGPASNPRPLVYDPASAAALTHVIGLEWHDSGSILYTVTRNDEPGGLPNHLYRVDRVTGHVTPVGPLELTATGYRPRVSGGDLAFDSAGTLHLVADTHLDSPTTPYRLYTVDVNSGQAVYAGPVGATEINAIAFDGSDTLYAIDHRATGTVMLRKPQGGTWTVGPTLTGVGRVGGLAFDAWSQAFFATDANDATTTSFYRLALADLAAGSFTVAGPLVVGSQFNPAPGFSGIAVVRCGCPADLMVADSALDVGAEPNPDTGPMWVSPAIWVRNKPDGLPNQLGFKQHQNPEYRVTCPANYNYVYVEITNRGCVSENAQVELYAAAASTGLGWQGSWITAPDGMLVGSQSVTVPPQASAVFVFPWCVPDPAPANSGREHWCLLARIAAPEAMTFSESASINSNVRNNNNLAWKNVIIVDQLPGNLKWQGGVRVANPTGGTNQVELGFAIPRPPAGNLFDLGSVTLDLGGLMPRWLAAGAQGAGIVVLGDQVQILSPEARIRGLVLLPEEHALVTLSFVPSSTIAGGALDLDLVQHDAGQAGTPVVGGQRFAFNFPSAGCTNMAVTIGRSGSQVVLSWGCADARLQGATSLSVPPAATAWSDITGNSPVALPASGGQRYFRLVRQ